MNSKLPFGLVLATLAVLLGCSTSKSPSSVQAAPPSAQPVPPPRIVWRVIPPLPAMEPPGQFCLLGTTCLAMDPRPFEPCLLSSKHCKDKAAEPMQVAPPRWPAPESGVESIQVTYAVDPDVPQ